MRLPHGTVAEGARRTLIWLTNHCLLPNPELAKPFEAPSAGSFLRFRFQHYQGTPHPVTRKVVLDVPVAPLFASGALGSTQARRKFLQLAGSRWDPSKRSPAEVIAAEGQEQEQERAEEGKAEEAEKEQTALSQRQPGQEVAIPGEEELLKNGQGWIKISCERFPLERQNMKWCSDTLDKLIREANVSGQAARACILPASSA